MVSNLDIASNTAELTKNFKNVAKTSNENSDKPISQPEMLRNASSIDSILMPLIQDPQVQLLFE